MFLVQVYHHVISNVSMMKILVRIEIMTAELSSVSGVDVVG